MGKFQLRSKGGPTMANTKSHGKNINYKKSGMNNADGSPVPGEGAPFLKGLIGGAKKVLGGAAKFGAFGPLGMMAAGGHKWLQKRKAQKDAQNANQQVDQSVGDTGVNTDAPVNTNAPMGSEGMETPDVDNMVGQEKVGAPKKKEKKMKVTKPPKPPKNKPLTPPKRKVHL